MLEEAATLNSSKDGARVLIGLKELQPPAPPEKNGTEQDKDGSDDESDEEGQAKKGKNKRKKLDLPQEEQEQLKIIRELTDRYRCSDKACNNTGAAPCYLAGSAGEHVVLTHMHLRMWAAAIQGKQEGVDMETPPNNKIFDPTSARGSMDVATLAKRRLATSRNDASPYVGVIELIREIRGVAGPSGNDPATTVPPPAPVADPLLDLKETELTDFCSDFKIPETLRLKLASADIAGPHILHLIQDADLRTEAHLSIGELATLRYAEKKWRAQSS